MLPMTMIIDRKNFPYIALVDHYDATNMKSMVKFCVPTRSIFTGPVTIYNLYLPNEYVDCI